jgi:hypothetical protein
MGSPRLGCSVVARDAPRVPLIPPVAHNPPGELPRAVGTGQLATGGVIPCIAVEQTAVQGIFSCTYHLNGQGKSKAGSGSSTGTLHLDIT